MKEVYECLECKWTGSKPKIDPRICPKCGDWQLGVRFNESNEAVGKNKNPRNKTVSHTTL